ncbi:MAG: type II toxin-antitoxin system RelE/ParE family toxin [Spirochaetota bacterium]
MASKKVIWENEAERDFERIVAYLKENWGNQSAKKFTVQVKQNIRLVSEQPKMFPTIFIKQRIRKCVIVKQVSMYYMELEVENKILVVRLLDNRSSPEKIQKKLEKYTRGN